MRTHVALLSGAAAALLAARSPAAPPTDDDEVPAAPRLALFHDLDDPPLPGARAPLWLAVSASLRGGEGRTEIGATLLLEIPLERLSRPGARLAQDPPTLKPALAPAVAPAAPPPPAADAGQGGAAAETEPPLAIPVAITPRVARAAVEAALREARLTSPEARLDALAARARSSSLLPELRLRATRLVDEAQSLAPTEYDPERTTASGGASLWLEARATWRLDRLVFADEEVAIERMRADRAEAQSKIVARVLDLLFAWQRAKAREAVAHLSPEERLDAALLVLEAAAALDVATGGWFGAWSAPARGRRPASR